MLVLLGLDARSRTRVADFSNFPLFLLCYIDCWVIHLKSLYLMSKRKRRPAFKETSGCVKINWGKEREPREREREREKLGGWRKSEIMRPCLKNRVLPKTRSPTNQKNQTFDETDPVKKMFKSTLSKFDVRSYRECQGFQYLCHIDH